MRSVSGRAAAVSVSVVALLLLLTFGLYTQEGVDPRQFGFGLQHLRSGAVSNRKLLQVGAGPSSSSLNRMGDRCSMDDIVVHQDATPPLPNGIPTYTVTVLNLCPLSNGCAMSQIHLSCGAFSSARLVNPRIFRRLRINDCLLNDGRPLPPGSTISFQYANSFSYPLALSSATCVLSS